MCRTKSRARKKRGVVEGKRIATGYAARLSGCEESIRHELLLKRLESETPDEISAFLLIRLI